MSQRLNRSKYSTNEAYLFHLYNDLGDIGLKVAYNYTTASGDIGFSKWIPFDVLMHLDTNDKVEGTFDTKEQFLRKVTHRTILDIEIMFDIDADPFGSSDKKKIAAYSTKYCKLLKRKGYFFEVYFSGSKSYHISLIFPEFRNYSKHTVETIRRKILERVGADINKISSRTMIALEGVPHWKTGVVKEEVKIE